MTMARGGAQEEFEEARRKVVRLEASRMATRRSERRMGTTPCAASTCAASLVTGIDIGTDAFGSSRRPE